MCEKRFFQLDFDEVYYIFDNEQIPKGQVIDNECFDDFDLSLDGTEVVDKLNEMHEKIHELNKTITNQMEALAERNTEIEELKQALKILTDRYDCAVLQNEDCRAEKGYYESYYAESRCWY